MTIISSIRVVCPVCESRTFRWQNETVWVNGEGITHLDTDGSVKIDAYKVVNYPVLLQSHVATSINHKKIYGVAAHRVYHHKPVIPRPQHF